RSQRIYRCDSVWKDRCLDQDEEKVKDILNNKKSYSSTTVALFTISMFDLMD
ncbi:MAG: hypothetical protein ACI9DM_002510, partial [Cyclobacteriaceae bacterium]